MSNHAELIDIADAISETDPALAMSLMDVDEHLTPEELAKWDKVP